MKLATRIFNRSDWYVTSEFGPRINPATGKKGYHYGTDYGTHVQPWKQYALEDGVVVAVRTGKKDKDGSGYGNYVKIKYPRLGIRVLHAHLKKVNVKLNQKVTHSTCIGTTGKTGTATGVHLHLGLQTTTSDTWLNPHEYDYQELKTVEGVPRNTEVDQLQVKIDNLRVRTSPSLSGSILGFVVIGDYYNNHECVGADGYTWYRIDEGMWIGNDKESTHLELLPKEEPEPPKPTGLEVGDKVKIVKTGKATSYGNNPVAGGIGWTREILKIYNGRPYPYQVGVRGKGTTGFYKEDALKKL